MIVTFLSQINIFSSSSVHAQNLSRDGLRIISGPVVLFIVTYICSTIFHRTVVCRRQRTARWTFSYSFYRGLCCYVLKLTKW